MFQVEHLTVSIFAVSHWTTARGGGRINICNRRLKFSVAEMSYSGSIERFGYLVQYKQGEVL